jgi:hypothetical protein
MLLYNGVTSLITFNPIRFTIEQLTPIVFLRDPELAVLFRIIVEELDYELERLMEEYCLMDVLRTIITHTHLVTSGYFLVPKEDGVRIYCYEVICKVSNT